MNKHFPIWILTSLVLFIFIFNLFATYWHLYFLIWWLDIPVHMLGGAWVALMTLFLYYHTKYLRKKDHAALFAFVLAVATALVVGLMWEVYEFIIDRAMSVHDLQISDTLKDLCDDLFGGGAAALLFIKKGYNKHI
jgi:hypothetical protein